jgi:hypothetical protein
LRLQGSGKLDAAHGVRCRGLFELFGVVSAINGLNFACATISPGYSGACSQRLMKTTWGSARIGRRGRAKAGRETDIGNGQMKRG